MSAANINLAEIVAADIGHHFHPFTDHKAFHLEGGPRVITHAKGVWIYDANGQKFLDAMSGLWCVNIGYGRKELADAAYRQMLDLPYYNTFFQCTHPPAARRTRPGAPVRHWVDPPGLSSGSPGARLLCSHLCRQGGPEVRDAEISQGLCLPGRGRPRRDP